MPDWKQVVSEHLVPMKHEPEVIAELANHLEDFHAGLLADGAEESEAEERTMQELANSRGLAAKIMRAREGSMNHRSKALWLPGLVSFTASAGSLAILQTIALQTGWALTGMVATSRTARSFMGLNLLWYALWLISQPVCGALAAWLSKRAGGFRSEFVTAGLFPSLIMLVVMCLVVMYAVGVEQNPYILSNWKMIGQAMAAWVLLPGLGLLMGTLPFWRAVAREQ